VAVAHDFLAYFRICLSNAYDVPHGVVAVGSHHIIRAGQEEEVKDMLFRIRNGVAQFTKFSAGRLWGYAENGIIRFGRSQMVRPRTYTADTRYYTRKLLNRSPDAKFLEASKLNYIYKGVSDVTVIIEIDGNFCVAL
jgi:hypothetical protein